MRRVARAPAPHTLVAGCSDPQEQAQSGSSGTCAQHTGAATRRQQHAGVRKRQTTLRRRAHYRGPRPAGTGTPIRVACSSPAMSHQRPRRDCRRPASTIAYKIGAQRRRDDDQTIAFSRAAAHIRTDAPACTTTQRGTDAGDFRSRRGEGKEGRAIVGKGRTETRGT